MVKKKMLDPSLRDQTRDLLLLHHSTLYTRQKRRVKTGQQLHIIRSLAEIGKRHSAKDVNKCKSTYLNNTWIQWYNNVKVPILFQFHNTSATG